MVRSRFAQNIRGTTRLEEEEEEEEEKEEEKTRREKKEVPLNVRSSEFSLQQPTR